MRASRWTREDLASLARGCRLTARDQFAGEIDPPGWLLAHADGHFPYDSQTSIELTHPEDRSSLVEAFLTSLSTPDEPVVVHLRTSSGGWWHHSETTWVNLVDHEDVGGIIAFIRTVDGPPIEVPEDHQSGEHASTRWMVWNLSTTGHITSAEGSSVELLGYEPDELVGHHPTDFLPPDSLADGIGMWVDLHRNPGTTATNRRPWLRRDGSRIWIEDSYLKRPDREGDDALLVVLLDATEKMAQEQALRDREIELQAREREMATLAAQMQALAGDFQLLADEVPAAAFRCDQNGIVLFHNARWTELVDHSVTRLHDLLEPAEHGKLDAVLAELHRSDSRGRRAFEGTGRDGRVWQVQLRAMGDADSTSLVGSLADVSATVQLRARAQRDALTGLANRGAVEEHLAESLDAAEPGLLVLFVDLDGFKQVNDTFGHEAGDRVLTEVAARLAAGVRPADLVARYGGDEFVIVCHDTAAVPGATIVDRLTIALGGEIAFPGGRWQPCASIGMARPQPGDDVAAVLRRADLEMFERKRAAASGRAHHPAT